MNMQGNDLSLVGYYPGVLGKITELHAVYYWNNWGFDISFETQVARELAQFLSEFQEGHDGFWVALVGEEFAGAIAIDGHIAGPDEARLRWFIVDSKLQGHGIGALLIQKAVEFVRLSGFRSLFLWTFKGLEAARKLYEREGFTLSEESTIHKWGSTILEQKYELRM